MGFAYEIELPLTEEDKARGITQRALSDHITYDAAFWVDGSEQLCHATGEEVFFEEENRWRYEFIDGNGEHHYR